MSGSQHNRTRGTRSPRFSWTDADVVWTFPPETGADKLLDSDPDLHTILWSLEHVTNQQTLDEVLPNAAAFMAEHPDNKFVPEAIKLATERVKRVTQ